MVVDKNSHSPQFGAVRACRRLQELTANRPLLVNARYLWYDGIYAPSNRLRPLLSMGLHTEGNIVFPSTCPARSAGTSPVPAIVLPSQLQQALGLSFAALASVQRRIVVLCTDRMGSSLHGSVAPKRFEWPPTCMLILSHGCTDGGGLQRHRVASCTFREF